MNNSDKLREFLAQHTGKRIYIENIRASGDFTQEETLHIINQGIKEGLLSETIVLCCPNEDCGRVLLSVNKIDDAQDYVQCDTCALSGKDNYEFDKYSLKPMLAYKKTKP